MSNPDSGRVVPKCVATTGSPVNENYERYQKQLTSTNGNHRSTSFFREAQFSNDGTTIVTHSNDHQLGTFVLPPDLLDGSERPHGLQAYSSWSSPSVIHSYAIYPRYDLQDPSTTLLLSASANLPITLRNALQYEVVQASYPSVNNVTEAYYHSTALAFSRDGRHFIAGSHSRLDIFDCYRDGSGPLLYHKTAASSKAKKLYNAIDPSCNGMVGALSISGDGVLAAGTMQRQVALYANEGQGECVTSFTLERSPNRKDPVNGTGISQLRWSPCGTYLLIAERQSGGVQIYDVRNMLQRVSLLAGRNANTTQKLSIDVVPTVDGYEVWGGGTDGFVRMWKKPGTIQGVHVPDEVIKMHDNAVPSAIWHPTGAVLATCSGQRHASGAHNGSEASTSEASDSADSDTDSGSSVSGSSEGSEEMERDASDTIPDHVMEVESDTALKLWTL